MQERIINLVLRGTADHKTLDGESFISYIFIKLSTGASRLKFVDLFDIMDKPVSDEKLSTTRLSTAHELSCAFLRRQITSVRREGNGS